jgi:predicted O-methyltransferase YrrM
MGDDGIGRPTPRTTPRISHPCAMPAGLRPAASYAIAAAIRTTIKSPLYDRAAMLGRLPRLAARRDPTSRALTHAVRGAAFNRLRADEQEWVARIDARRSELAADVSMVRPDFEPASARERELFRHGGEPAPIWGIAELFSVSWVWGEFLLRLVRELSPRSGVELGTALGLSTAYQAAALQLNGAGTLTTFEGARAWAAVAVQGLSRLGLADRATVEVGAIDESLPGALETIGPVDYAFLDADHTEEATVKHFDTIARHMAPGGVAVLDDIAFSVGMSRAWHTIRRRDRVADGIALGRMGILSVK